MKTWKGSEFRDEWLRHNRVRVGDPPAWEYRLTNPNSPWIVGNSRPAFASDVEYRWATASKRTVTINGKVLVAPETEEPKRGSAYVVAYEDGCTEVHTWRGDPVDSAWRASGNIFLTIKAAQDMVDWLIKCRLGTAVSTQELSKLSWLYGHCTAIGMTCKSDSGLKEHDIALFTINQKHTIDRLTAELGDLPESQADMLKEIKQLKKERDALARSRDLAVARMNASTQYCTELRERLNKYEPGSPMHLNATKEQL